MRSGNSIGYISTPLPNISLKRTFDAVARPRQMPLSSDARHREHHPIHRPRRRNHHPSTPTPQDHQRSKRLPVEPVLALMELTRQDRKLDFPAYLSKFEHFFRAVYGVSNLDPT